MLIYAILSSPPQRLAHLFSGCSLIVPRTDRPSKTSSTIPGWKWPAPLVAAAQAAHRRPHPPEPLLRQQQPPQTTTNLLCRTLPWPVLITTTYTLTITIILTTPTIEPRCRLHSSPDRLRQNRSKTGQSLLTWREQPSPWRAVLLPPILDRRHLFRHQCRLLPPPLLAPRLRWARQVGCRWVRTPTAAEGAVLAFLAQVLQPLWMVPPVAAVTV